MKSMLKLYAPERYWTLTPGEKKIICSGCGTPGILSKIVPNTVWGLNIRDT